MGKLEDKVDVVYNWIDTNHLKPIPRSENLNVSKI